MISAVVSSTPTRIDLGHPLDFNVSTEKPGLFVGPHGHTANVTASDECSITIDADLTACLRSGDAISIYPPRSES